MLRTADGCAGKRPEEKAGHPGAYEERKMKLRMKKITAGILILCVSAGLAACAKQPPQTPAASQAAETSAPQTAAAPSAATAPAETSAPAASESAPAQSAETPAAAEKSEFITAPQMTAAEYPMTDGSTANLPLARMLYRVVTGGSEFEAQESTVFTTTNNCYQRLMDKEVDLVIAYEPGPDAKNDARFKDVELTPIGLDALVFLCNEGNPVKSLTAEQLQDIYSGKTVNWKELGGADKPIIPFQRTFNSGSQTLMQNLVMKDREFMDAPAEWRPGEMGDLVENVAAYNNEENAIGYSVYYYASSMYTLPGLRFMQVGGVEPDNDTIQSGKYPFVNAFYAGIRKDTDKNSNAYKLYEWLTTEDGQSLVEETGYVSIRKGGKKLADEFLDPVMNFATDTPFAFDGTEYDGIAGLVIFDGTLKQVTRYTDLRLMDDARFEVIRGNAIPACRPAEVNTGNEEEYPWYNPVGIADIRTGKWIVEPKYLTSCYNINDRGEAEYYMIEGDEEDPWDNPGRIMIYDTDGNEKGAYAFAAGEYSEALEKLVPKAPEGSYEYTDRKTVFRLGGSTEFIRETLEDGEKAALYMDGELEDEAMYGYSNPLDVMEYDHLRLPVGWNTVTLYDMDKNWDITDQREYLLDSDGKIVSAYRTALREWLLFATEDYMVFQNETGYTVTDMNCEKITEWQYTGDAYDDRG